MNTAADHLIRRELWEHRSLWIAPLVVAGLIVIARMFPHADMRFDRADVATHKEGAILCAVSLGTDGPAVHLLMSVQLPFYLLDCLYAERKDRSILFWKALPVSDAQTVFRSSSWRLRSCRSASISSRSSPTSPQPGFSRCASGTPTSCA